MFEDVFNPDPANYDTFDVSDESDESDGFFESVEDADDFDKYEPVLTGPKIGRNDPCPCGSGKKYKKCCLNK